MFIGITQNVSPVIFKIQVEGNQETGYLNKLVSLRVMIASCVEKSVGKQALFYTPRKAEGLELQHFINICQNMLKGT